MFLSAPQANPSVLPGAGGPCRVHVSVATDPTVMSVSATLVRPGGGTSRYAMQREGAGDGEETWAVDLHLPPNPTAERRKYRIVLSAAGADGTPANSQAISLSVEGAVRPGDVNGDGVLDNADLDRLTRIYLGEHNPEAVELAMGDIRSRTARGEQLYGDGKIEADDLNWVMRRLKGLEDAPCANPQPGFMVSITYDVEMNTNFPDWLSVWDDRKGKLDDATQAYILKLLDIVRPYGAKLQFYILGSSLESANVGFLDRIIAEGHSVGNHTYHHVNIRAQTVSELQTVYAEQPWRAGDRSPFQIIEDEIVQTGDALAIRYGKRPVGFRAPGGFEIGLNGALEIQTLLKDLGFPYVSTLYRTEQLYPAPSAAERRALIEENVRSLQPFRYPNGLLELPMMGISDIDAFRVRHLSLSEWLDSAKAALCVARAEGLVLSLIMHPSVLAVRDPDGETLKLVLREIYGSGEDPGFAINLIRTNDEIALSWPN
jgi:peptidoglycan/xylan/chitin deacetylase (PgdA/CDA1 family)